MASNSLRGGKRGYQSGTLISNWCEDRMEPSMQEKVYMHSVYELPTKASNQFSTTGAEIGSVQKDAMKRKQYPPVENVLKYCQLTKDDYVSSNQREYSNPKNKTVSAGHVSRMSEEKLEAYRKEWSNGEPWQFHKKNGM